MAGVPKLGKSSSGQDIHYSIGALVKKGDKYLLIDRAKPPLGHASLAGHIDERENELEALIREVKEESGLNVVKHKLLYEEEIDWNWCSKGVKGHYWYLFECEVEGEIKRNFAETKSIGWYTKEEIASLNLEPVWEYWFKKLGILTS